MTRLAMNRAVRTVTPARVTSLTSTTPRPVVISTRRPAREAVISYVRVPSPASMTISTRSPLMVVKLPSRHGVSHVSGRAGWVDTIERMFEYQGVSGSATALRLVPEVSRGTSLAPSADTRTLPVLPALTDLFPAGGLRRGASYIVQGSQVLALALLAGPSAAGSWCAAVATPTLGLEAAAELGVELDRLAVVPMPGSQWLEVVAALADAFDVVLARPPDRLRDTDVRRLTARFREHGTTLIALGPWRGAELLFTVAESRWVGLGRGYGHLAGRQVSVTTTRRPSDRPRAIRLWLPSPDGAVRAVAPEPVPLRGAG